MQLTGVARDSIGNAIPSCAVSWGSSDTGAATVSASGLVTGVGGGQTATTTAAAGSATGTAAITVTDRANTPPTADAGPARTSNEGASVSIVASFTDVDAGDVHTPRRLIGWTAHPCRRRP